MEGPRETHVEPGQQVASWPKLDMLTYQTLFLSYLLVRSVTNVFRTSILYVLFHELAFIERHFTSLYFWVIIFIVRLNYVIPKITSFGPTTLMLNAEIRRYKLSITTTKFIKFCKGWYFEISLKLPVTLRYVDMKVLCGKIFKKNLLLLPIYA